MMLKNDRVHNLKKGQKLKSRLCQIAHAHLHTLKKTRVKVTKGLVYQCKRSFAHKLTVYNIIYNYFEL